MVKKFLLAALLAGSAMPAQAVIFFEFSGTTSVWQGTQPDAPTPLGTFTFSLKGPCWGPCQITQLDSNGVSLSSLIYHYSALDLSFSYDEPPVDNYADGTFHRGVGSGSYVVGYVDYTSYSLRIDRVRMVDDGNPFPFDEPYAPEIELGRHVPEPSTWAMMIAGFAVAGMAMRHRKAAVSFA